MPQARRQAPVCDQRGRKPGRHRRLLETRTSRQCRSRTLIKDSPRIIAKVKHRKGAMVSAFAIRSFIARLRPEDSGLYVCTGGFTKEARYEADRAYVPVRLLDLDSFVRNYVETYDKVNDNDRAILPLTRVWLPA